VVKIPKFAKSEFDRAIPKLLDGEIKRIESALLRGKFFALEEVRIEFETKVRTEIVR
jgi:hypothetical protein